MLDSPQNKIILRIYAAKGILIPRKGLSGFGFYFSGLTDE
jgi:hypothetical protein